MRVVPDKEQNSLQEQVCLVQLTAGRREPDADDYLESYQSNGSELEKVRFCHHGYVQTYFSSELRKMVLVRGN